MHGRRRGSGARRWVAYVLIVLCVVGLWAGLQWAVSSARRRPSVDLADFPWGHRRVRILPRRLAEVVVRREGREWDDVYHLHEGDTGWVLEEVASSEGTSSVLVGFGDGTARWYPRLALERAPVGVHVKTAQFVDESDQSESDSAGSDGGHGSGGSSSDRSSAGSSEHSSGSSSGSDPGSAAGGGDHSSDGSDGSSDQRSNGGSLDGSADREKEAEREDQQGGRNAPSRQSQRTEPNREGKQSGSDDRQGGRAAKDEEKEDQSGSDDGEEVDLHGAGGGDDDDSSDGGDQQPPAGFVDTLSLESHLPASKPVCAYPALHPRKWAKKFGWGERKEFPLCSGGERPFSRLVPAAPRGKGEETVAFTDPRGYRIEFVKDPALHYTVNEEARPDVASVRYHPPTEGGPAKLKIGKRAIVLPQEGLNQLLRRLAALFDDVQCDHDLPKGGTRVEVNCSVARGRVVGFAEPPDEWWERMGSLIGAERRQNKLRNIYTNLPEGIPAAPGRRLYAVTDRVAEGVSEPYVLAQCGSRVNLHLNLKSQGVRAPSKSVGGRKLNVLHLMFDSTSLPAFIRALPKLSRRLEHINNRHGSIARVFTFKHFSAVSCCSPGNQVPMYAGAMNGEGDPFVMAEPLQKSKTWLWSEAAKQGYRTFWSLDNCPDKSARDYHAWPRVDHRVVVPTCLAGVLLSHKEKPCLAERPIDEYPVEGLRQFWDMYPKQPKYAAVQLITPHEETEKLLIELDDPFDALFKTLDESGELNNTAVVFFADHGINFGRYASTPDGSIERMFPFAHVMLPRWLPSELADVAALRHNQDAVVTPYDMHQLVREIIHWPQPAPPLHRDPADPPLPLPTRSHIVASMPSLRPPASILRSKVSYDRTCTEANIPEEFCTCIAWTVQRDHSKFSAHTEAVASAHKAETASYSQCEPVELSKVESMELQVWPTEYKPKEQALAKKIWMEPKHDMLRIRYWTESPGKGLFEAVISMRKGDYSQFDIASLNRLDAMKKKCGVVEKTAEHLCVCK
eukprot:TRINITY_DN20216_c0_g1_i1.p1 TRINITY_DN20216_c0_g1~~TRINITY_DN20216_c0_g1_i1.p1  ORF type:complete len:1017 (+),score=246.23 TRINITY_DN20216_c0_g1_i1:27-3077(+)